MESTSSIKQSVYAQYYEQFCESKSHKVIRGDYKGGISKDLNLGQVYNKWVDSQFGEHLVSLDQITYRCEYFSLFLSFFDNFLSILFSLLFILPVVKRANAVRFFTVIYYFFSQKLIIL